RVEWTSVDRITRDVAAVQDDAAGIGLGEAADHPQDRGLARTRGPQDGDELAVLDREVDLLQHPGRAERLADPFQLQKNRHPFPTLVPKLKPARPRVRRRAGSCTLPYCAALISFQRSARLVGSS